MRFLSPGRMQPLQVNSCLHDTNGVAESANSLMPKNIMHKRQEGVTLFEVMLVIVIGAAILYLSISQYQIFKSGTDVQQLQYNVDTLFQSATKFYKANCISQTNPTTGAKIAGTGLLDPANSPANPYIITPTQLQNDGYLAIPGSATAGTLPFPISPLVNSSGTNNGYQVQYNLTTVNRTVKTYPSNTAVPSGTIYIWTIQVSVQLLHPETATQYLSLLGADCISTPVTSGTGINPCSAGLSTGTTLFLVWQRLPSMSTSVPPGTWIMNPTVTQFNQMYTTDPMTYLLGNAPTQNYLCGS